MDSSPIVSTFVGMTEPGLEAATDLVLVGIADLGRLLGTREGVVDVDLERQIRSA